MIKHGLYHAFVFLSFIPMAVLYRFGLLGAKSDMALYRFRRWCYPALTPREPRFRNVPTIKLGALVACGLVTLTLLVASVMTFITGGANSSSASRDFATTTQSVQPNRSVTSFTPKSSVKHKAIPKAPSILPMPVSSPISFVSKLTRTMQAPKAPPGKQAVVTAHGNVVYVPTPSASVPKPTAPPSATYSPVGHSYSPPPSPVPVTASPVPSPTQPSPSPVVTDTPTPSPTVSETATSTSSPTVPSTATPTPTVSATDDQTDSTSPDGNSVSSISDIPNP